MTRDEDGLRKLFRQFSFPGGIPSHVAPETPGLDPRGRRARLRALARLRRRVRQPRPARLLHRRRRRGGDRAARDRLALEQVPQPGHRRRRAADPAPERLQDRQPDGARPDRRRRADLAARGVRAQPSTGSTATTRRRCTSGWPRCSTGSSRRSRRSSGRRAPTGRRERPRWPMIVLRTPKGWTGPKIVDGLPAEGSWRSHQVPLGRGADEPGAPRAARGLAAQLPARGAVRRAAARSCRSSPACRRRATGG